MINFPGFKKGASAAPQKIVNTFQPPMVKGWKVLERSPMIKKMHKDHFFALSKYDPPYIRDAADTIAREKGFPDHGAFTEHTTMNFRMMAHLSQADPGIAKIMSEEIRKDPDLLGNAEDHMIMLVQFADILTALHVLSPGPLSDKKGLQVGCGHGPFIYFMKEKHNVQMKGIDTNAAACRYAKNNGLDIDNGDARKMPYPDSSFDFVISQHFLEEAYLNLFMGGPDNQLKEGTSSALIARIVMEIHRVLRPGGMFLSYFELGINEETLQNSPFCEGQIIATNSPNIPVYVLKK